MDQDHRISFEVDCGNLYREESLTDLKVAVIRKLVPIKTDGSDDTARASVFVGHSQVMSPEGPIPLQAELPGNTLEEAMKAFPRAMEQAMEEMVEHIRQLQREQQRQESRIITPGR
ncbi:MAG: cytoplasmic protein [Thermodesulfobacteriota bacterium]